MNLTALEKKDNFFNGLKDLFASLHVPVNYIDEKAVAPKEILSKTFKDTNEAYQIMDDVFILGMVDDAAFEGKKSETIAGITKSKKDYEGILIFGITLKKRANGLLPTRSQLAEITRAFNREFYYTPVVVVFRYEQLISIANAERIAYKQEWREGEKTGKVSLLRDINISKPHTGHLKILQELTISRTGKGAVSTFAELYTYWQSVFNVSILNKKFYKELSDWYFWALHEVEFPATLLLKDDERVKEHNAKNLIRMLTRLLFVWFVKEKNLIPEEIFDESYIRENLINGFEPRKKKSFAHKTQGSKYYRAILQNLFFATLNQTVGKREFRKDGLHMNVTNLMRYESYFKNPKGFIKLMENIVPFMNGGLFECLDCPDPLLKGKKGGDVIVYEDGFSDRKDNSLCVPDYIFFGIDERADLSEELGDNKFKDVTVNGLINILNSYKFTVTENTPIEEDVALDPELLGRVFENLLASYNPETRTTARKQTGSFYTPREIVNYMVDESLKAYLKQKLETEAGMQPEEADNKLSFLIGYDETYFLDKNRFNDKQANVIIKAIDNCKILDPACGSGAFPMGILHKLVHILHKIDSDNKLWKEVQRQKAIKETDEAFKIGNKEERENRLKEISDVFEHNSDDYGRKLFLIENCIYGVDIQPIATQISKLRFFISLIVDQKADKASDNFGIRPLPNLETKFVSANTLIGIEKPKIGDFAGSLFDSSSVKELEDKLKDVRHRLFSAKTPATKRKLREEDQRLREEMGTLLTFAGWGNATAKQLAGWDPYNQNASSPFFDREWMFGIADGFDVVIGNPPYIFTRDADFSNEFKDYIANKYFSVLTSNDKKTKANQSGKINLFALFILRGLFESKKRGTLTYIVPNNLLRTTTYDLVRKYLLDNSKIEELVDLGSGVFDNVTASTIVFRISNSGQNDKHETKIITNIENIEKNIFSKSIIVQSQFRKNVSYAFNLFADKNTNDLLNKIANNKNYLGKFCIDIIEGIVAHKHLISESKSKNSFPLLEGKTIKRFGLNPIKKYITWNISEIHRTRPDYLWNAPKKIIIQRISGGTSPLTATLDTNKYKTFASINNLLLKPEHDNHYEYLLALLNSKVLNWYYANSFSNNSELTVNISKTYLEKLPIVDFEFDKTGALKKLVSKILSIREKNMSINTSDLEKQIDEMVYKLYELTEEEIAIIEGR